MLVIVDLHVPPGNGFVGPGLVQFEYLEENSCKFTVVKHGVPTTPYILRAECEPRLSMSSSNQTIFHRGSTYLNGSVYDDGYCYFT